MTTTFEALAKATAFADKHVVELAIEIANLHNTGSLVADSKLMEFSSILYVLGLSGGNVPKSVRIAKCMALDAVLESYVNIVKSLRVLDKGE